MPYSTSLSFRKDVSLVEIPGGGMLLQAAGIGLKLEPLSKGAIAALDVLLCGGATRDRLSSMVLEKSGFSELPKFDYYLENFIHRGLICYTFSTDDLPLATVVPCSPAYKLQLRALEPNAKYSLSRFAYSRKDGDQLLLESPLSPAQIFLSDWRGMAIFSLLAKPQSIQELQAIIPELSSELAHLFLKLLLSNEIVIDFNDSLILEKEKSNILTQWEFHDLLFHFKSRRGRHLNPVGKTYHFLHQIEPLSPVKQTNLTEWIDLYKPDLQRLAEIDHSFSLVLEKRMSVRTYGEIPLSAQQLGEFLYRCARVREIFPKDHREGSSRPYPSGGACYELELYLVIRVCKDIPAGLYHYCPKNHQLGKISLISPHVKKLLEDAKSTAGLQADPQVLLIITARFARVSWLYESMAYSLILKHVGILYQTMYLVATAMNIAPCALGTGNSDLFALAANINEYAESSVGEFILGAVQADKEV